MALTDLQIKASKPGPKPYKLTDEKGLFLLINPNGSKYWRLKYRFAGKEKMLALGVYPEVTMKIARERRDEARKQLAQRIDPGQQRKILKTLNFERASNSFEAVAVEWFDKHKDSWATGHSSKIIDRLKRDVFPWLGGRPIAEISAPEVLAVLRRIEGRGAYETAHRAKGNISQVIRYAIATGRAERDPCPDLRGALKPATVKHFPAITDPKEVGVFLRVIEGYKGTFISRCALRLAPLLFTRPGELRTAEWSAIDLERAEWRFRVNKNGTDHLVPLAHQALEILREIHPLSGGGRYVFPGRDPKKPMSEATINAALRRMGFDTKEEITGHGFRAMARTILHERLRIKPEIIEHQLSHRVAGPLGGAYDRTKFIDDRKEMMQRWADYLDELKRDAELVFPSVILQRRES